MTGVSITYDDDRWLRGFTPHHPRIPVVKASNDICPISNLPIPAGDTRRWLFLIGGKAVPVNAKEFLDRCDREKWGKPDIWAEEVFDVEFWLIGKAIEISRLPVAEVGGKWAAITEFARTIGLKTDFISAVRSVKRKKGRRRGINPAEARLRVACIGSISRRGLIFSSTLSTESKWRRIAHALSVE